MRKRFLPIIFIIYLVIVSNISSGYVVNDCAVPVLNIPVYTSEGIGEVFVTGDDICIGGVTELEGTVPIEGSMTFGGPVRASGKVTIAGRCAPAGYGFSPLRISPPLAPPPVASKIPLDPIPTIQVQPIADVLPISEPCLPALPTVEVLPSPNYIPTVVLPPVVIPAYVVPAYVLPEVVIPAQYYEIGRGCGDFVVTGNDVVVSGATYVDGVVPALGEISFSGYIPAKGSVTICSHF